MKIIDQSHEILFSPDGETILKNIELAGRTCYQSEGKITADSAAGFVKKIIKSGHHSVIEHMNFTIKFITDRGVSHELVRHRLASYSQESTRYCMYKNGIAVIRPVFWKNSSLEMMNWETAMNYAEMMYVQLLAKGAKPEQARSVLPNSLKTVIVMTANIRELRHILSLRTSKAAHPQIRELMIQLLHNLKDKYPVIFDDIGLVL